MAGTVGQTASGYPLLSDVGIENKHCP
jgi:hypothetical protein